MERVLEDSAPANAEVDFHLLDAHHMATLNEQYLDHDGPTDVITFSYLDDPFPDDDDTPTVGEVFVCPEVAQSAAPKEGTTLEEEVVLYLVHGILHLGGFDDVDETGRTRMRGAEREEMAFLRQEFDLTTPFKTP